MSAAISFLNKNLKRKINQIGSSIGKTPLFEISKVYKKQGIQIFAKLEWQQFGGSIKSRPAFQIIKTAIYNNELRSGKQLLDATSGNTGIAYGSIGAALGIPITLCLSENASEERKQILKALGVKIIYTSKFESTDGAQEKTKEIFSGRPDLFFYANQYANENNWKAHYHHTAPEIWQQTKGKITHFVAGLGTTGTFTGTSKGLKYLSPTIQTIALQPNNPMHGLEGWKHLETAVVPKIYDASQADRFNYIDTLEAFSLIKKVAQKEGLLISPSAAANLLGAIKIAEEIEEGLIVTTFADNADKYAEIMRQII